MNEVCMYSVSVREGLMSHDLSPCRDETQAGGRMDPLTERFQDWKYLGIRMVYAVPQKWCDSLRKPCMDISGRGPGPAGEGCADRQ